MRSSIAFLIVAASVASAAPLQCGVATDTFPGCPQCLLTALDNGMSFHWNWDTFVKVDDSSFTPEQRQQMYETFVPMLWGQGTPDDGYAFLSNFSGDVMTYNEPDNYAPACVGSWNPPAYGCAPGEYRAANSDGWAPTFSPDAGTVADPHSALLMQWSVQNMTTGGHKIRPGIKPRIISPSMANGAKPGANCIGVDPSLPDTIKDCQGWMATYKTYAMNLTCTRFDGTTTNCWDVLDAIQIHAYSHYASAVLDKIQEYYDVFQEDFEGTNGRSKKTLWLTEVAHASANETAIVGFINDLFDAQTGLMNRDKWGFVERVSWFSDWSFGSFTTDGIAPKPNEVWASSLFNPFGGLSAPGQAFFGGCSASS